MENIGIYQDEDISVIIDQELSIKFGEKMIRVMNQYDSLHLCLSVRQLTNIANGLKNSHVKF